MTARWDWTGVSRRVLHRLAEIDDQRKGWSRRHNPMGVFMGARHGRREGKLLNIEPGRIGETMGKTRQVRRPCGGQDSDRLVSVRRANELIEIVDGMTKKKE